MFGIARESERTRYARLRVEPVRAIEVSPVRERWDSPITGRAPERGVRAFFRPVPGID